MCTEADINRMTREIVAAYRSAYGDALKAVYLYGSYARGEQTEESDVDYAAIVQGERLPLQQKLSLVWDRSAEIGLDYDVVISPTVIPYDEFLTHQNTLPYYRNILTEGQQVG